jgi:hypothetical protein
MDMVPATLPLIREIFPLLRAEDLAEVTALCPENPRLMLENSLSLSDGAWVLMVDGKPGAIWGVQGISDGGAALWMLGTEAVPKKSMFVARYSKEVVASLLRVYTRIEVLIDVRYRISLRWAEWLGFKFSDEFKIGPLGAQFVTATLHRGA